MSIITAYSARVNGFEARTKVKAELISREIWCHVRQLPDGCYEISVPGKYHTLLNNLISEATNADKNLR